MLDISEIVAACGLISAEDSQGTGYLVAPDRVATCAHVVQDAVGEEISIAFNGTEWEATVGLLNRESDCAILLLKKPVSDTQPLRLGGRCKWKAPWDSYGFPSVGRGAGVTLAGIVSNPDAQDDLGRPVLELTSPEVAAGMATPLHGFSGSPVLVDGLVVGHLKRFLPDLDNPDRPAYGKVYATRSECVLNLFRRGEHRTAAPSLQAPPTVDPPIPGSAAARVHAQRVQELVRKWSQADMPEGAAALLAAESFIQLGRPGQALKVLRTAPMSIRADQLRALALAKTGKPTRIDESIEILKKLRKAGHLDEETGGILAGRYKQKWQQTGDKRFLRQTYKVYVDTFKNTKHWYPGINAAASALWLEEALESKTIARQVLRHLKGLSSAQMDQWQLAAKGEAYLLTGNLDSAKKFYSEAVARCPGAKESIRTMQRQARLDLKALGLSGSELDDVFRVR